MTVHSIRFQIVLWHVIVLSLTFIVFGAVLYHTVSRRLNSDLDALLLSKAAGIRDAIDSAWDGEKRVAAEAVIETNRTAKDQNVRFAETVRQWTSDTSHESLLSSIDVGIFDSGGRLIATSAKTPGAIIIPQTLNRLDIDSQGEFVNSSAALSPRTKIQLRALTVPVEENDRLAYLIRVISPLASLRSFLRHLKVMLLLLFPFVIMSSGLAGAFLAKVVLTPVDRMIDTIHRISAENLRLRVKVPDSDDELESLAETFNGMLDRLEQSFSSQRQFIEDLTHELKTPLSVLKGELEVTLKKMRTAKDYESILRSSLEEVNQITKISENLLLFAYYDSDQLTLEKRPLDITELVRETLDQLTGPMRQKSIAHHILATDRILIAGDQAKLRHLFLNILDNALKYTPVGGRISIDVRHEKAWAKISITDTGVGIRESELPRVFDRFFRGEKEKGQGGFGLGLSIAKAIAEAHLGKIEVTSTLHQGTTFTVSLPLT